MAESIYENCKIRIGGLKCNHVTNPIGVDTEIPMLGWELTSGDNGQCQTAFRILAASRPDLLMEGKADLWDTGWVDSDTSIGIPYGGKPLESRQQCWWKAAVKDRYSRRTDWSEAAFFEMGLLHEHDWNAKWICSPLGGTDVDHAVPVPLFRKTFFVEKKVVSARAYVCGLGYYELYINGMKIGDDVLSPAFTRYDKTVLYNSYDITEAFDLGENVIGVMLGNGWYNCFTSEVWDYRQAPWRHHPKLIIQVHITLAGGDELTVISDSGWKVSAGPIIFDGLRNGEFYDARLEKPGWNRQGYDDGEWKKARISRSPGGLLKSSQMPPIKVTGTIKPVGLKQIKPEIWVYDFGQNISGWAQITVSGLSGTEIMLKYAEKLTEDGLIDQTNINIYVNSGEFQTDKYILKGGGLETWEPRFTYHGFQYVQVEGFPGTPTLADLSGRVVHTALDSFGSFECSDELLNKIQQCARWSTLTNYHSIPTDCPHREKNAWTGDASLSAEQVLLNFNPLTAYTKWMNDFRDVQRPSGQLPGIVPTGGWGYNWGSGPAWDSAIILIPWYMYLYCGDKSILETMYGNMEKYIDYMASMSDGYIVDFGLGDWCPPGSGPEYSACPSAVTDTAYYYADAVIAARIAEILEKPDDKAMYSKLADNIRNAFRREFLDVTTGNVTGECQTSMATALYQGLVNEDEKQKVFERLVEQVEKANRHIDCGILGAKYVMHSLNDLGRADLAYAIAEQTDYPGWGYWIVQGATTLWETWIGNSSRNHHMFSDISAWFYKGLAGINPDPEEPGFKHTILRPNPVEGLYWVKCRHKSPYGWIECNWKVEEGLFSIDIIIPVNCHAVLYPPKQYSKRVFEKTGLTAGTQGMTIKNAGDGTEVMELLSGTYKILYKKPFHP